MFIQRLAHADSRLDRTNMQPSILEILKTRFSHLPRYFSMLCLAVWAEASLAAKQNPSRLGLQLSAGQSTLIIAGMVGTIYSIQNADDLCLTNSWTDRTLLQAQAGSNVWSDPSSSTTGRRFYRAVAVAAPADTNLVF